MLRAGRESVANLQIISVRDELVLSLLSSCTTAFD